ncbi:peptidoglycan-binding domain-containing protein [Methylocystis parvus]|nr:peptidoglycan-binding domain-containing protein [Methylocystis parvus]
MPKKKPSVLARVFAPQRMGVLVLLGIGGLAFVGVPMNALFLQDGHHPAPLFAARTPLPQKAAGADVAAPVAAKSESARIESDAAKTDAAKAEAAKAEMALPAAKPSRSEAAALKAMLARPEGAARAEKKHDAADRDAIAAMLGGAEAPVKTRTAPSARAPAPEAKAQATQLKTPAQPKIAAAPAPAPKVLTQPPKAPAPKAQPQTQATAPAESVATAQRSLQRLGYVVKPDGVLSPGTRQAIEKFERDNGLPAKGDLTPKIAKLLATRAAAPHQ